MPPVTVKKLPLPWSWPSFETPGITKTFELAAIVPTLKKSMPTIVSTPLVMSVPVVF